MDTVKLKIQILMAYASRCTTSVHACRDGIKTTSEHARELAEALKECYEKLESLSI